MKKYGTILADPPWPEHGGGKVKRGADRHYPLLALGDIARVMFSSPVWNPADDAHLYLWTTSNYLPAALRVMQALDFRYVSNCVWVKMKGGKIQNGLGQYFRHAHELLLFGTRGKAMVPEPENRISSVLICHRKIHSQKPLEMYGRIQRVSPGPYLEMFCRGDGYEGWDTWGNECSPTD